MENYQIKETQLKKALNKLAILEERLFNRETNLVELARLAENVRSRRDENVTLLNKKQEVLNGLQKEGLHVDLEIANILNKNKIDYETGEAYLRGQSKEYQKSLLDKNPMLPYCYIVTKTNIEKVEQVLSTYVYRITPIICYEDINKDIGANSKFINISENIKLACLYNNKAFDVELKIAFENEITEEIEDLKNKIVADDKKIIELEEALKLVDEFKFESNYRQNLEEKIKSLKEEQDNEKRKKLELKEENKTLIEQEKNILLEINNTQKTSDENEAKKKQFENYLNKNNQYMDYLKIEAETVRKLKEINTENEETIAKIKIASDRNIELNNSKNSKQNKMYEIKKKDMNILLENGNMEIITDKTLEELEKIYQEITSKENQTIKNIQERIERLNSNKAGKEKSLNKKYSDLKEEYEKCAYDENEEDEILEKIDSYSKGQNYLNDEFLKASNKVSALNANFESIQEQLQKIDKKEPLQAHLIKRNYEQRKKNLNNQISETQNFIELIITQINKMETCRNTLLRTIDAPQYREVSISQFDVETVNTSELMSNYEQKRKENDVSKSNLESLRSAISNKYKGENQVINNFLNNMNPYQNSQEDKKFADYYFVYERVTECLETMNKLISALKTTIANIEKDKENVKYHAFMQAKTIYSEMKKISDSSTMKIAGKLRKVPILEIGIPKELDQYAEERINEYIEECINNLREKCKNIENAKKIGNIAIENTAVEDTRLLIEKEIDKDLSDRILLNKIINSETIGLKLYKIDISEAGSGLRSWEDVIVGNSGGEKMISCLILVLALMQYSREKVLEKYGDTEKLETSKILILDNPFGKMSSNHLLDGLMNILDRFNVQVICLSDISQSSITNHFKVIYQMSLKSGKYTEKSYLTVDNIIKSEDSTQNYLLENAYLKVNDQIKMW